MIQQLSDFHHNIYMSSSENQQFSCVFCVQLRQQALSNPYISVWPNSSFTYVCPFFWIFWVLEAFALILFRRIRVCKLLLSYFRGIQVLQVFAFVRRIRVLQMLALFLRRIRLLQAFSFVFISYALFLCCLWFQFES